MLGALIAAGSSLVGSILGKKSSDSQAKLALRQNAQQAALAAQNRKDQITFAKKGIRWKVNDAKAAGLHPLAALGAQTTSFNPVSVGSVLPGDNGWYNNLSDMGQNLGRAVEANMTRDEKYDTLVKGMTIQRMGLENQLLQSQIARSAQINQPAFPGSSNLIPGQGNSGAPPGTALISTRPMRRSAVDPNNPSNEPGAIGEVGFSRMAGGGYAPSFSDDLAQRMDENHIGALAWAWRNHVLPTFGFNQNPPSAPLPPGQKWIFNPIKQGYTPHVKKYGMWWPLY